MVVTIAVEGVRVPGVTAELYSLDNNVVVAQTKSDGIGQVTFPDVPAGLYTVRAIRDGFADGESLPFGVRGGAVENVLMEMRLTFVRESVEVIAPTNSPTESLQPVAVSDVLNGAKMDIQPLAGDDFQSLLAVLPSIIRGPEGRLRIKGGAPTTGALQISSASLNDPSTGDFDLELPSGAVESVEVLSNPFAAEYGRFSTSVTQVRTKRGTNDWSVKADNLVPGFGKGFVFVNKFEPRLSISGPLKRDKLLLGQYFQYRFAKTEVRSLPDRPQLGLVQLRFVHPDRRRAVVAPCADRRGDLLPSQDRERHAVDLPPAGGHAAVHPGRLLRRPGRSPHPFGQRRARNHRGRPLLRDRPDAARRAADGLRAAERRAATTSASRNATSAACRSSRC